MKFKAKHIPFVILEHRGVPILSAITDLTKGALKEQRIKFARDQQNDTIDDVIDEVEGKARHSFHLGEHSRKEIVIKRILYIISNPFWTIPVYEVDVWNAEEGEWMNQTYQNVRWNTGVQSGVGVLCITKDNRIVFIDEFRHTMRHLHALSDCIDGFDVPRYGLRTEMVRGLLLPVDKDRQKANIGNDAPRALEEPCKGAIRIARNVAGVQTTSETQSFDLGHYDPDTGVLCQHANMVAVTNVVVDERKMRPDVSEAIYGPRVIPLEEVFNMMDRDEIRGGFSHHAILRALIKGILPKIN